MMGVATRVKNLILCNGLIPKVLSPIYKLYERQLLSEIRKGPIPKHVGVILDGNRRWARMLGKMPWEGHKRGYDRVKELLEWCHQLNIKVLTLYAFSIENFQRPKREVQELMQLVEKGLRELMQNPKIYERRVRVRVIGRLEMLPENVRKTALELEKRTRNHSNHILNIALAYGGRYEILDAVRKVLRMVKEGVISIDQIDERIIEKNLYTAGLPKLDLIIRTSGEERLSGFLLWQSINSELYVCDVYWPNFRKIDFLRAIRSYQLSRRMVNHN